MNWIRRALISLVILACGTAILGLVLQVYQSNQKPSLSSRDLINTHTGEELVAIKKDATPTQTAWQAYVNALQEQREKLLQHPAASDDDIRAQGLYALHSQEASAFNMYIAPRQQYPAFAQLAMPTPMEYSWGMPCPDFLSHMAFIDGAHTYRIHGNKKTNFWSTLQVFSGFWGDDGIGVLGHLDFDELAASQDGSFEIFLGPNPKDDGKQWIKLDPNARNVMLSLRETFYDWGASDPMDLHIEALDRDENAPQFFSEAELAARIDKARKFVEYNYQFMIAALDKIMAGSRSIHELPTNNQFLLPDATAGQHGGNPLAAYVTMVYDLKPDEALIIDMGPVDARYWSFQLGTLWAQTTDFIYHQSSINGHQAQLDADGHFRAVLSLTDPGVANWLDPAGVATGMATLRFYKFKEVVVPSTKRVPLSELRKHLPEATLFISAEQRKHTMLNRQRAAQKRYGH